MQSSLNLNCLKCNVNSELNSFARLAKMDNDMILWQDGIGYLPGSDLRFRVNEFGLTEILDDEVWQRSFDQSEALTQVVDSAEVERSEGPETCVQRKRSLCSESNQVGSGSQSPIRKEVKALQQPSKDDGNDLKCEIKGSREQVFDNYPATSHEIALADERDNFKVAGNCLKFENKNKFANLSREDLTGTDPGLQVTNVEFKLKGLSGCTITRPTTKHLVHVELASVMDPDIVIKNETSTIPRNNRAHEIPIWDETTISSYGLKSDGVIFSKPGNYGVDLKSESSEVPNNSGNSHAKKVVSKIRKQLPNGVADIQVSADLAVQSSSKDNQDQNWTKNIKANEDFLVSNSSYKIKGQTPTKDGADKFCIKDIQDRIKAVDHSEVPNKSLEVPNTTNVDLKPDMKINTSSEIAKIQNCSQETFKSETQIKCENMDSDDSGPSSPFLIEEELPDIEPLPPVGGSRISISAAIPIRTRSRSRSLSPMFHLPPPPLENKSHVQINENSDGIPVLKAETEYYQDKDIAFCQCCGCFGLVQEFYESIFCTKACGDSYKYHLTSPDGKFKKPPATTPKKSKFSLGGDGMYTKGEVNAYNRSLALDQGISNDTRGTNKLLKKKSRSSPLKKSKAKQTVAATQMLQLKSLERRVEVGSSKKSRRVGGTKSTAFHSKDRKRNFPLVLSKRMPVSPERKGAESLCKDVQLSPDITLGKAKQTPPKMTTSSTMDFEWQKYLSETKSKTAPHRLFRQPAMPPENPFRPCMFLESIDPQHQSLICVASVIETQGYRVRLRFEGFSEAYDYWVNADSLDIFPPGWCEENNLELQPPPGAPDPFNWHQYIVENRVEVAPRHIFAVTKEDFTMDSGVKPGMKMEAVDIRNQNLVCVATVAKVMGERILVHFDSWDSLYDYWTDLTSPYIHPVGWCEKNSVKLTPPNYCKPDFTWEKYLRDTNTIAMPSRLFRPLPPVGFRKGFKIECVDKRNPFLIRVATISEVDQHNLVIHFDNWPSIYDFKVYELSPDIHPVGWCAHTGHPLQPPPPADGSWKGPCTIVGCLGLGHIRGPKFLTHNSEKNCPYALHNYKKDWILADRITILERNYGQGHNDNSSSVESAPKSVDLKPQIVLNLNHSKKELKPLQPNAAKLPVLPKSATIKRKRSSASSSKDKDVQQKKLKVTPMISPPRTPSPTIPVLVAMPISVQEPAIKVFAKKSVPIPILSQVEQLKVKSVENINYVSKLKPTPGPSVPHQGQNPFAPKTAIATPPASSNVIKVAGNISEQSRFSLPSTSLASFSIGATAETEGDHPPNLASHAVPLKTVVANLHEATVSSWRVEELARFISTIPGCEHTANRFLDQLIDGESFLMLSQNDFINVMGLKLGPAIKLSNVIRMISVNSISTNYKPN